MLSAPQLFFSPHKGKYMQTPPGAKRNPPPPPPPRDWLGRGRWRGLLGALSEAGLWQLQTRFQDSWVGLCLPTLQM